MKKLLVVDLSNFIFRAYFGIRGLKTKDGFPVNAIYGVLNMIITMINQVQPTHLLIAIDSPDKKFRHKIYPEYKGNRKKIDEELKVQIPIILELIKLLELPNITISKYEADDIIGSISKQWANYFDSILIASGDKDLMQLVNQKILIYDSMKNKIYTESKVQDKFGIRPDQIVDYLSLIGDSSDNIPGVKGIGPKGAQTLLKKYQTLENIYANTDELKGRVKDKIINGKNDAFLSKKLIIIVNNLELNMKPEQTELKTVFNEVAFDRLKELECFSIVKKLRNL